VGFVTVTLRPGSVDVIQRDHARVVSMPQTVRLPPESEG
jgi:hypothetical protein